ncbi:hypothetical protein [Stenotrophomonas sp. PS02299]|uniref:hypothetical protein n=1 Tax=Stenotrophomonas TaxID=40323 RepID=UPI00131061F8|nr:hypothetical protein [Stenotrophomonas sp. PS02299]
MKIKNNHNGPLGLPDGTILPPGEQTPVANWEQLKKNSVVQGWIKAEILSIAGGDASGSGQGIMVGTAITDQIIAAFAKGTTFAGMRVERKPWTSSIIQDPERVMHPVTIPWRGFFS